MIYYPDISLEDLLEAIEALIGEVQETPTVNTILARLKDMTDRAGEVQVSPTAYTILGRLKVLEGYLAKLGEVQESPTQYTLLERLKVLDTLLTAIKSTDGIKKIVDAVSLAAETTKVIGTINIAANQTLAALTSITNAVTIAHGKTCKSITGTISATATIIAAVANKRIKVFSFDLFSISTSIVTVTFKNGEGGAALATYPLQAITSSIFGIVKATSIPSCFFATAAGALLELSFSAAVNVTYNLSYWDDDAT
jgi:hypothetical protein